MKRTLRLLSMVMAIVCLFAFSLFESAYGITETVKAENRLDNSIDTLNEIWNGDDQDELGYSPLVGELTELRESDIKHFRRADGISEMVVYPYDVHFESDGRWIDIDNTLVETTNEDGETVYRNTASDFVVSFAPNLSSDSLVTIEYNGYTLSWGFADGASGQAIASVAKNEPKKDCLSSEEQDELLVFPPEISSDISYCPSSTRTNTDQPEITYSLNGKSLSEFIKLTCVPSGSVSYSLNLNCPGLTPQCENGVIKFLNEDEEIVFIITAPFMYDAAGAECTDIEVTLTANSGGYLYSIVPDNDWLKDVSRVYPVVIDPDVVLDFRGNIDNVYIRKDQPDANFSDSLYGSTDRLKLGNTSAQCMSLIKLNSLPTLNSGDVVVSARLYLTRYGTNTGDTGKEIDAYKMLAQWSEDEITWNSYQALNGGSPADTRIEAFAMSPAANAYNIFDVTNLVKYWYRNPSKNYGVVLKASNNVNYTEYVSSRYSTSLSNHPCFSIAYINSTGIEGMFSYSSQDAGRAGVGNINLFSGNLTFSHDDASVVNGVLPIGVSHVYNTNDRSVDIGYGRGWRLNYAQQITGVTLPNRQTTELYYEYIDGDGTRHYYTRSGTGNTEFVSELDKDSVLTINTSTKEITIKDKGDNKLVFACELFDHDNDSSTAQVYRGRLIRIEDANGNKTLISYTSTSVSVLRISSISEQLAGNSSSGQSITFSYSDNHLSSITPPDGLTVSYAYDSNNCLTGITASDGNTCTYTYNNRYCMTKAEDITGYSINYTYNNASPYRVLTAQEMTGDTEGQQLTFEYKKNVTTIEDSRSRKILYQFTNYGQAVCVRDPEGRAAFAAFNTGDRNIAQLAAVSKTQSTVFNLLEDHGFERCSWTAVNASFVTTHAYTGKYSAKLSSAGGNAYVTTSASVTSGQAYTLSAYFTGGDNAKLQVLDASGTVIAESDPVQTPGTTGTDWSRGVVTFIPETSTVTVKLLAPSGNGTIYADAVQLEVGRTPNRYNMLENSDFSNGLTHYTTSDLESDDKVITGSNPSHPEAFSAKVFRFEGNPEKIKSICQTITVNGKKGDSYSFGGWVRTEAPAYVEGYNSNDEINLITISVKFLDSGGNTVGDAGVARFDANTTDWQFACSSAVASEAYSKISISVTFTNGRNMVYTDGLQLYRETFSQAYSYDENGNLVSSVSLIGQEPKLTYDSSNNVISSTDPLGNETTYTYDGKHNLLTSTSPGGIITTNVYDANGNVTETRLGSSTTYIRSQTSYNSASALAESVTDARGNSVTYTYDSNTRQQMGITDARGNTSTYSYGNAASMLRLASFTGDGVGTVNYGYDSYGRLNSITRGSTAYNFTYDEWGRTVSTGVGNTALSTNVYDEYNRLSRVQYGNGSVVYYFYDSLDRVSAINKGNATMSWMAYGFIYDGEGNLYELRNYETGRATFFEYDHAGRCMASTEKSFTGTVENVTYGATVAAYRYKYDENNQLIRLTQTINGTTWSTEYTYDTDGRQQLIELSNGKTIEYAYGATTGRPDYITLHLDSDYVVDWTYKSGANGSTTALISTYTNGSDARYNYNYDANGNITQIWRGSVTFANASEKYSYVYDEANQLIRENLCYGTGNSNNATITYEYDSWGNLLNKKIYAYTTGTLGAVQETVTYTYGNSSWQDQLTSYNGQSITYDASGNPTNYLGAVLAWEGQRLKSYTPASTGSGRVNAYTYNYDENGIRTRKTVGNTVTDYYYNGSLLIGIVQTTTNSDGSTETSMQRFSYDADGKVVGVNYNGTYYYYLRNAQGDIVKLIDKTGSTVVSYTYDTWGKLLSTTGSLAATFGAEQPFRYRGYVYDEETGFYYLQSRYYDPEVGRFISADVYLSTGQGVIGHNAYAYCGNNPVTRVDDEGEFWNIVIGAIVGAIVGAVVSAVTQAASGQDINWAAVGVAAACGALSGAVNAACPCMGVAATGLVQGSIGALEYAGTELAYGRTPTLEKTLMAGVTTGMFAAGGKFVAQSVGLTACFIAGTQVITTNGMVSIENISEGDYVYATDPETGESGFKRVVQTFERETDELVEITCDGETITTTPTHPFYVPQKGWTEAIKLRAGDILVTSNGEYVVVEKVQHEILEAPITVYNFEVEDYHTYYVSADADSDVFVLVHNKCIVNDEGVRVEVRTSNEHGLPHAHVTGRGPSTTIGLDKKPMPKHPALSAKQIRIINRHWEEIVDAIELFFPRKQ